MKNKNKLRVLCLDTEGGYGGSSRSLFNSVANLDNSKVDVEVWCKRSGIIQSHYKNIGIKVKVMPGMPKITALPKLSRNLFEFGVFLIRDWPKSIEFRKELLKRRCDFDIVHCNSEALYWLAKWIDKRLGIIVTMHKRKNPRPSLFSYLQEKLINNHVSGLVFITENERDNFNKIGKSRVHGRVIYNIVSDVQMPSLPLSDIPGDDFFKVCTLANYSFPRGVDQLIDIAIQIKKLKFNNILFVVAGDIKLSRSLPGKLGIVARSGGDLSDYARKKNVENMFLFLGYVKHPDRVLSSCHVLVRPSRERNPWGRDVLEALSFGLPVIAAGSYNRFVENNKTGFLFNEFDVKKIANCIVKLSQDSKLVKRIGRQGRKRVQKLCNGVERSNDLLSFWSEIASR